MDAVMAAMETEAAAEAMAYDGVIPETLVMLVEALTDRRHRPGDGPSSACRSGDAFPHAGPLQQHVAGGPQQRGYIRA